MRTEVRVRYTRGKLRVLAAAATMMLAAGALASAAVWAGASGGQSGYHEHHGPNGESDVNACADNPPAGYAYCHARVRNDDFAKSSRPHPPEAHNSVAAT